MLPGEPSFRVVILHILFNSALILGFTGLVDQATRIAERFIPDPPKAADEHGPKYIPGRGEEATRPDLLPVTALAREVLRILGTIQNMLDQTRDMLVSGATENAQDVNRMEDKVNALFKAVRAGTVLVANALGSGLLQSAALPGFLPGACEKLLGETLRMPSVGTWWCGEQAALEFVVEHLDRLVIKGAFPSQRLDPIFGSDLKGAQREEVIERLHARPQAYVAQELVRFSQAPSWSAPHERRLLPRGVALRVYVAATPQGYRVMPGGLTRVTSATDARFISMQRGGSSKDTWVLSDEPVNTFSLIKPMIGKADLVRSGSNLSSRVVENLFWFGRYTERCEDMARLLRIGLSRLVDAGTEDDTRALMSAYETGRALKLLPEAPGKKPSRSPASNTRG